eukprot:6317740-Amphidinium_carterae.1
MGCLPSAVWRRIPGSFERKGLTAEIPKPPGKSTGKTAITQPRDTDCCLPFSSFNHLKEIVIMLFPDSPSCSALENWQRHFSTPHAESATSDRGACKLQDVASQKNKDLRPIWEIGGRSECYADSPPNRHHRSETRCHQCLETSTHFPAKSDFGPDVDSERMAASFNC